jgi:hypoxanthine phosphoribosyltransferase
MELYPVLLTRRENDQVVRKRPKWIVDVSEHVAGKSVAVVDDIADTGQTLEIAAKRILQKSADRVVTAVLVTHSWAHPKPDFFGLLSDALVIFPWHKRVYHQGTWGLNQELVEALKFQKENRE